MKKTIIIIVLSMALVPIIAFGQKLQKPIIDKITGDTTYRTSQERIATITHFTGSDLLFTYATKTKAGTAISFVILNSTGPSIFSINENSKAILKLQDNTIVALGSISSTSSSINLEYFKGIDNSSTNITGYYLVSPDDYSRLLNSSVTVVRIETSKGNFDYDIKAKNGQVISKLLQLLNSKP